MSRRLAAVMVAMVVVLVASGFGVARATTGRSASGASPAVVKACRTSSGYLVLPTKHHSCTHGTAKVTLDVPGVRGPQGVRGQQGAPGAPGAPGAQGPGARSLKFAASSSTTDPTVTLNGWTYQFSCSTSGGAWTTTFAITAPTAFNTYTVSQIDHNESGSTTSSDGHAFDFDGYNATLSAASANAFRDYEDFYLDGFDGTSQHVYLVWSVDARSNVPSGESRCMAAGQVVPAS